MSAHYNTALVPGLFKVWQIRAPWYIEKRRQNSRDFRPLFALSGVNGGQPSQLTLIYRQFRVRHGGAHGAHQEFVCAVLPPNHR